MKLVVREPETEPLRQVLPTFRTFASNEILAVELARAGRRISPAAASLAEWVAAGIDLVRLDDTIRMAAMRIGSADLRALDAIHLATAVAMRDRIGAIAVYDRTLAREARKAGLRVIAPA